MKSILIMTLFSFLLAGCGQKEQTTAPDGKILLTVWESYNNEEHELFQKLMGEYSKLNPDIDIKVSQIPWSGHEAKFRTSLAVGGAPDIGRIDTGFLAELVSNDAVHELDQFGVDKVKDEYVKAAFYSNVYKGHIYGLPDQTTGVCLFYNKGLFRSKGLDPNHPPETWEEFLQIALKLTDPGNNVFGFGMDNSLWWTFPFFNTFGAKFISDDGKKCLLDSPEAVEALQYKVDLYQKHKVEGGAWIAGAINSEVGFLNNRYAMVFMGPWNVKNFQNSGIDFGVSCIPAGRAGTSTNVGGSNMVIFKTSNHPKEAYDLLRYITGADFQARWAGQLSQIPTNLNAASSIDKEINPILAVFMEQMKSATPRP
ncbi:MAG: extracellular solute-binding protein, partial [Candidatus Wallbacteria bacterium]|nr:extracellular solute-binding protein [Candidatus Wallbacteria bacterium]